MRRDDRERSSSRQIQAGEQLPSGILHQLDDAGALQSYDPRELFQGKRGVLIGVPGPFTPGCSEIHLPGYIKHRQALRAAGIERVVCLSLSDAWVMRAWGETLGAAGAVELFADGSGFYSETLGLRQDLSAQGFGLRCKRFALLIDHGEVREVQVDPGPISLTSAEAVCAAAPLLR